MATPVNLVGPDGKQYVLTDPAELQQALAAGYREETTEAPRTLGEQVKAGVGEGLQTAGAALEGAVRGAAPGAMGVALGGPRREWESPEDFERRKFENEQQAKRREAHPVAAIGGELAGMLVSPIAKLQTGAAGALGATTALGRVGANVVGGGAVGALYGAGNTLDEAALGNTEVTAEKLVAGAGLGALLGAAGGGIGTALEEGVRVALPAVTRKLSGAGSILDEIANDAAIKASRSQQGVINRIGEEKIGRAAQVLRERGHIKSSPDEMLKSLEGDVAKVGAEKGAFLDAADAGPVAPDLGAFAKRLDEFELGLSPVERQMAVGGHMSPGPLAKARLGLRELEQRIGVDVHEGERAWRSLDKFKRDLQAMAKFSRGAAEDDLAMGLRRQVAGVAREELDRQLVPALGTDGQKFLETKALYGSLKDALRLAESGAGRVKPSGLGFGMYDFLAGIAGGAVHPAGLAMAVASKFAREQAPALIAKAANAISQSPHLKVAAQSFAAKATANAPHFGQYAPMLAQAIAHSPAVGLATHMTWAAANPDYAEHAQRAGFLPETPEEDEAFSGRSNRLVGVGAALKTTDDAIDAGIKRMFRGEREARAPNTTGTQDFGTKRMRRGTLEAHERRMSEVAELAANPEALLERVTKNLGDVGDAAPGVAAAATAIAHRAVTYLSAQIQRPPKPGPLAEEWKFNDTELYVFSQKLEAVERPLSVLEHGAAGTLTEDQVEAVRAVYPTVYAQMRDKALEALVGGNARHIPYKARLAIHLLTGVDADGSVGATATNQQAMMAAEGKPSEQMAQTGGKDKGALSVAKATATPQQRREMEHGNA